MALSDGLYYITENQTFGSTKYSTGDIIYISNGVPTYAGLVKSATGDFYYINSSKKAVKNCYYGVLASKTNGLLPAGTYQFDSDGVLISERNSISGLHYLTEDYGTIDSGEIVYLSDGELSYHGAAKNNASGDIYYINSSGYAVRSCFYGIPASKSNGLIAAGVYEFDAYGILIQEVSNKNGCYLDDDGYIRYYVNGKPIYAGVVEYVDTDGKAHLVYINSSKRAVKDCYYGIPASKANGLLAAGTYRIDANGYIIIPQPQVIKQGLYAPDGDGEIRYYIDGESMYVGVVQDELGNLYYIDSSKKAVRKAICGIPGSKTNGLIEAGIYEIDKYGVIINRL